ncbi:MFS transporter [Nocardioides bruguierae]|uniref:MFS transporter n=1 Tax=Nocardioides bruguierae TaxID=2945102 RepID=A0A9X2III6_9ACTN|nr:MFS transporter [Nocardioides bruguierae]MCM0622855.1 MFS transporter [Nocardioides bruguierae]
MTSTRTSSLLDVRPLRESGAFRRLWIGDVISGLGQTMGAFTVAWLVWERTHSATAVSLIGMAQLVPMVVFTLLGGSWADRYDRRTLLVAVRWAQLGVASGLLLVVTFADAVAALFPLIALQSALGSVGNPVSRASVATLLTGDRLAAGLALSHTAFQMSMLLGPLIGGILVATQGVAFTLALDALAFLAAIHGARGLPRLGRPKQTGLTTDGAFSDITAGVQFVARTPILAAVLLADLSATVFAMPLALFPVLNDERFGGSPATLGLFVPALGLGGIAAGVFSGRITRASRQGLLAVAASIVWGAALCLVGLTPWLWVALALLAVAGAADVAAVVCRGTIVQSATPDEFRGRVSSLDFLVGAGGPKLGDLRAGLVSDATSGAFSMAIGGAAATAMAVLIAARTPSLRGYRHTVDRTGLD